MRKHLPEIKLSRQKGVRPKKSLLNFDSLAWNIADGILYGKGLDDEGSPLIIPIGGKGFWEMLKAGYPREIELSASETHIVWRLKTQEETELPWINLVALEDLKGDDGKQVIIGKNLTHILWKYQGEDVWHELMAIDELKGEKGDDGKQVIIGKNLTHILWKYQGEDVWQELVALDHLKGEKGDDGREILIGENATHILWKYQGEDLWNELLEKHPTGFTSQPDEELSGNWVISQVIVNDKGHIEGVKTRQLDQLQAEAETQEDVTAAVPVGGISAGDTVPEGTSLTGFVKQLLHTTFYPTFVQPTASLSLNVPSQVEAGHTQNLSLTMSFSRGQIRGVMEGGSWNPGGFQNHRAGPADYFVINSQNTGTVNSLSLGMMQIGDQVLSYSGSVFYQAGPQPLDSEGNPYGAPLAGGSLQAGASTRGRRKLFYGHSSSADTSTAIRSLQSSLLHPTAGTSFTINVPAGATNIVIAYPASLRELSSVVHVEGMNAEIKNMFSLSTISVSGANGFTAIACKVYVLTPVAPLEDAATFNCMI